MRQRSEYRGRRYGGGASPACCSPWLWLRLMRQSCYHDATVTAHELHVDVDALLDLAAVAPADLHRDLAFRHRAIADRTPAQARQLHPPPLRQTKELVVLAANRCTTAAQIRIGIVVK